MKKTPDELLTVRFVGKALDEHGASIYDLGRVLVSVQRLIHKAFLASENQIDVRKYPTRPNRARLAFTIIERRRGSDWYGLAPILTDPAIQQRIATFTEYVMSGLVAYASGRVLDTLFPRDRSQELVAGDNVGESPVFLNAIFNDVVNIVGRIDAAGEVDQINIGAPRQEIEVEFGHEQRRILDELEGKYVLGPRQEVGGAIRQLDPFRQTVQIRRPGGKKCLIHVTPEHFEEVRYNRGEEENVRFGGRPRFPIGTSMRSFREFEADEVML